jgi:hypothetical protein
MGVPTKIGFFFWGFEVTYPPIFEGSKSNGAIKFPYTYDLRTTLAVRGAGGCLTAKKGAWCGAVLVRCGAVFVDLFHFLLLFVIFFIVRNFYKLLFTAKTGVKFITFYYVFYCL